MYVPGGGGHSKKFRQGCSCHFFGFEVSQFVILGGVQNEGYFLGVEKISIFLVNWKFALFFGLLRKETTKLLPRNKFPFTLLFIF